MRRRYLTSLFLPVAMQLGCAANFQQVSFAGEGSAASENPPAAQTVFVVPNAQMTDSVLESRIRKSLETFLLSKGYVIASPDAAELYVMTTFGSGKRLAVSQASVFRPAEVTVTRDPNGAVVRRVYTPDRMQSLRVPTYENSVWLMVLSSDAKYFRDTGMVKNLWRGESAMKGSSESLSAAAPYMLVPALKFFGKGTERIVQMDVRSKDLAWQ